MAHRWSASTAPLILACVIGCGGNSNPVSPAPSSTPASAPARPALAVVPGFRLNSITPPSGSTVAVSPCVFPADQYPLKSARVPVVAGGPARPLHQIGDCTKDLVVKVDVQVAESSLSRVLVQFVNGDVADGGTPCAGASWTGAIEAGSAREFVFNNVEVWCEWPLTTNRLLVTLWRCAPDEVHAPCRTVLAKEEFVYAYYLGGNS